MGTQEVLRTGRGEVGMRAPVLLEPGEAHTSTLRAREGLHPRTVHRFFAEFTYSANVCGCWRGGPQFSHLTSAAVHGEGSPLTTFYTEKHLPVLAWAPMSWNICLPQQVVSDHFFYNSFFIKRHKVLYVSSVLFSTY